jgi:hypothetical protein
MIPDSAGCGRRLYRKVQPLIVNAVHSAGGGKANRAKADRYRKHFKAVSHIWLLVLHIASGSPSLRQSHARLGAIPGLYRRVGLPNWISLSQLARSSTSRGAECFESLVERLTERVRRSPTGRR